MTIAVLTEGEIADLRREMRGHHAEAFISAALSEIENHRQRTAQYERAMLWRNGYDTGSSSETIWAVMMGVPMKHNSYPLDVSDFGRCYRLLKWMPAWRPRLPEVAVVHGKEWVGLVAAWDEITAAYEEEKSEANCPKTYALIKRALGEVRR